MFKRIGLPILALAAMVTLISPPRANAAVRLSVRLGGPVYAAPVPIYPYAVPAPALDPYPPDYYSYSPDYACPAPVYAAPYGYRYGYRGRSGFRGYVDRDRYERHEHEYQRESYRRDRR